jgi:catechol 2,3-dioxygenase-like lactoylglutathione lyase family enzyme
MNRKGAEGAKGKGYDSFTFCFFTEYQVTMKINQPLHAALVVSNITQSEHFYGTVLNLSKVERNLKFSGAWYQVGDFQIHLIAASTIIPDQIDLEKWGRNRHLAFSVANLDEAKKELITHNYPFQMSASGRAALFTKDPDGNIIELSE